MSGNHQRFKVVSTDAHLFPLREEMEVLGKLDCTVVSAVCKSEDETIAACRDAHVVLDTAAKITRRVIGELKNALAICRYGIGVDTVDIPAATEHGIVVANVPDFCFDEVADTAMSLILSVPRKVHLAERPGPPGGLEQGRGQAGPQVPRGDAGAVRLRQYRAERLPQGGGLRVPDPRLRPVSHPGARPGVSGRPWWISTRCSGNRT